VPFYLTDPVVVENAMAEALCMEGVELCVVEGPAPGIVDGHDAGATTTRS
jgi:hypothetical protein